MRLLDLRSARVVPDALVIAVYAAIVFAAVGVTPFWLDEILQLGATRHRSWAELLFWVRVNPGASPLPYFIQEAVIRILGFSTAAARLPAALCSILSGLVFLRICRRYQPGSAWLATALFLAVPLQFRYALEARGYSQGLLFSLLALLLFLRLCEAPSAKRAIAYDACLVLGLYSHPFTLFPALSLSLWGARRLSGVRWRRFCLLPLAAAALTFLPWWIAQHRVLVEKGSMDSVFFSTQQVGPLTLLHDLAGSGYFTAVPLLAFAAWAWVSGAARKTAPATGFGMAICCGGPIAADALFNYFFAPRQFLFAMPYLVLAAASGASALWKSKRQLPVALGMALFFTAAAVAGLRLATRPKDDLYAAASVARSHLHPGACLEVVPRSHVRYFAFFYPELESRICVPDTVPPRIVAVVSPYSETGSGATATPSRPNYAVTRDVTLGSARIVVYDVKPVRPQDSYSGRYSITARLMSSF